MGEMDNKKAPVFTLRIATIIIGVALFKQIDFKNLTLENPALGIVYSITLTFLIYIQIKVARRK